MSLHILSEFLIPHLAALDGHNENGVRSRAVLVHVRGAHGSILIADVHHMLDLVHVLGHERGQVLDVDAPIGALLELVALRLVFGEQVAYVLLVDLEILGAHKILLIGAARYVREYVVERVGYDAAQVLVRAHALHGERLAGARLTVGEYGAVEAVEHALDQRAKGLLVQVDLLRAVGVCHLIN